MKRLLVLAVLSILMLVPIAAFAQTGTIAGQVTIADNGNPLANAAVYLGDSKTGTYTKQNGQFSLKNVPAGTQMITVSMMGYAKQTQEVVVNAGETSVVKFEMEMESINIEGISVLSDRAESDTPIAYTDVDKEEITSSLGSRDIPLVLSTTPSVYSTGQGGGAGDARINIRGFDQTNVAVMINGVPINDMENGWVYWSNWDGLGDATSSIQVQRGLSAINLAVPSIGGTMNMITDPTQMDKGVRFKQEYGSGGFQKKTLIANSGMVNDKYAFSFNVTRKTGDGVVDATWTDAWSYYLATSYKINDNNRLEFYAAGAPQRHGQNSYKQNMAAYNQDYAKDNSDVPDSLLAAYFDTYNESEAGMFYNENWNSVNPTYKGKQWWNGNVHNRYSPTFINERENFYHKPQINLNWFTKLNEKLDLYSIVYYSGGKGGGTGTYGSLNWDYSGPSRVVDFNKTIAVNDTSSIGSFGILRNSVNQQWTIGAISRAYYQVNDEIKSSVGLDWRTAEIDHFREVRDLMGGDYYTDLDDEGNPVSDFWVGDEVNRKLGDKIDYYNTNKVGWFGGYAQGEYAKDKLKASLMAGLSAVKYDYTDHFVAVGVDSLGNPDPDSGELQTETDWIMGYQAKGGLSYRLTNSFGIYGNAGYINKCPIFDEVINDWTGELVDDPENEKFMSAETGFNFVGLDEMLHINTGLYYTNWIDQSKSFSVYDEEIDDDIKIFVSGIDSRHIGGEMEIEFQPFSLAKFDLAVSKGDWIYLNDLENVKYEAAPGDEDTLNIYVKDLKVGDAPQTQLSFGTTLYPVQGLDINVNYNYFDDFYAAWDPFSRQNPLDDEESWQIPAYGVMDLHVSYKLPTVVKGFGVEAYAHIFNLLDEVYVQDATDNSSYNGWGFPHSGSAAEVFFGLPRTFNAGVELSF